ncbi:YhhN-like protein [Immersiella caudata]|uniref:YhhN-like protein n=1 Tax=Immersiella caudata TaxID=314043 RepID=A0AA40C322_9PEZI|nr:YhhN-like protein [Immersiella caudata]
MSQLAVLMLSVASATTYLFQLRQPPSISRAATKTASTTLLSFLTYIRHSPSPLTTALALGSLGDAFLAFDSDVAFLRGLASFLVAHLLYIRLFAEQHGGLLSTLTVVSFDTTLTAAAGGLASLVAILLVVLLPGVASDLRLPVLIYSLTIFTMGVVATAVEINRQQVLTGALLFTASDAILALDRFLVAPESPLRSVMQYSVWTLYYSGQLLIALGF